jgi:hypothetical protein
LANCSTLVKQAFEVTALALLEKPGVRENPTAIAQEQDSARKKPALRP